MQIAYTSQDGRKLPYSMGYGLIDPLSIIENDGTLEANYISEISSSVVHKVTWSLKSCKIETFNTNGTSARLPVKKLDDAYLRFKQDLLDNKLAGLFMEQKGHYLEFTKELTIQNLYLVSFIVPIAQIHAAAKYFAAAGIIGPDKPDRLIIDEANSMRTNHMRVFTTYKGDGHYALLFQELTKQNYNAVIESFIGKLLKL